MENLGSLRTPAETLFAQRRNRLLLEFQSESQNGPFGRRTLKNALVENNRTDQTKKHIVDLVDDLAQLLGENVRENSVGTKLK